MSLSKPFVGEGKGEDVKLTGLDVPRKLQGNRALTLISAYAMYTSNVDVLLSV